MEASKDEKQLCDCDGEIKVRVIGRAVVSPQSLGSIPG
jgi:hypothetical protein